VFPLHAETVDRKDEVKELKARCDAELAQTAEKSGQIIAEAQQEAQKSGENIDATVGQAHELEFVKVKKEFDQVKSNLYTQWRRIIDSATQPLRAHESD
jgi:F0F1-type ATP synthase membrane subunit b/b'